MRRGPWVIEHKTPVILVRGIDAGKWLRSWGYKPLWSHVGKGQVIDDRHLPDVLARLESEGLRYRIEDVTS